MLVRYRLDEGENLVPVLKVAHLAAEDVLDFEAQILFLSAVAFLPQAEGEEV